MLVSLGNKSKTIEIGAGGEKTPLETNHVKGQEISSVSDNILNDPGYLQ